MTANSFLELELAQRIPGFLREAGLLRHGYRCEVHLHRAVRKKRRDAEFEGNWEPATDSIRISFSPMEENEENGSEPAPASSATASSKLAEDRLVDLLRALDRAETRPGYEFVSLKWFRDTGRRGTMLCGRRSTSAGF